MKAENLLAIIMVVFLVSALFASNELSKEEEQDKGIIERLIEEISTPVPEEEESPLINLIGECPPSSDDFECPIEHQLTDSVVIYNFGVEERLSKEEEVGK